MHAHIRIEHEPGPDLMHHIIEVHTEGETPEWTIAQGDPADPRLTRRRIHHALVSLGYVPTGELPLEGDVPVRLLPVTFEAFYYPPETPRRVQVHMSGDHVPDGPMMAAELSLSTWSPESPLGEQLDGVTEDLRRAGWTVLSATPRSGWMTDPAGVSFAHVMPCAHATVTVPAHMLVRTDPSVTD